MTIIQKISLLILIVLFSGNILKAQISLIETKIGNHPSEKCGYLVDISKKGNRIVLTRLIDNNSKLEVVVYEEDNKGAWKQIGNTITDLTVEKWFGQTIAISGDGNTIAIGLHYNDAGLKDNGVVLIYTLQKGIWQKKGSEISGEHAYELLGFSLDLTFDGNTIAIAAPALFGMPKQKGKVTVYQFLNENWIKKGNAVEGTTQRGGLGYDLSISNNGNMLVLNEPEIASIYPRKVLAFEFGKNGWDQIGTTLFSSIGKDLNYGKQIAFAKESSELLVNGQFEVYGYLDYFNLNKSTISQNETSLKGFDGCLDFGRLIAISDDGKTMVTDCSPGIIKVYQNVNKEWNQIGEDIQLKSRTSISSFALSGDGKRLVIGAHLQGNDSEKQGKVFVYDIAQ